jgi:iron complex outermembrane receptor protein
MPLIPIDLIDQTIREKSMTVGLKKKWPMQKHTLSLGAQFRHKHFDTTDVTFHSPLNIEFPPLTQAYYTENVYSLFLQDLYEINEKQVLSASVMLQHYDRRGDVEDQNTAQIRLGYIYSDRAWVSKTFLSQQQFASEPYMTVSAHYGNAALKAESYNMLTQEISYEKDASHTTLVLAYGKKNRAPFLEAQTFQMHNADEDIKAYAASLEWRYDFRDNDILQLQAFLSNNQTLGREGDDRRVYGGMARLLNSIDSFDVFNELTYREGYFDHDAGIDYSAGVIYHVSKDFSLNVKGENIFNNAVEWEYANRIDYNTMKATDTITKPTIEQKFWIGMEYLF